ncbi:MAG: 3-hydroxyacyl-CoA dehydrogenase NAD-binding domain-containing protein [candidate division KSB1 bacterium]|nr:3-hydroxyacyl-CoA dehydrogenase NAD-binding domain-containing protein [candidate division KSB1 bacterium]MDZ7276527.1 3-hydroxyacyl-CoA dehydrogenase NAD-binding domain-containing protein [candidate division KSB1 bacterium]MDZ7286693.1 3-hydroxyacyl-CoA dehydrogenase NAD-binding domain-containing protein [candidate division KSB1 bacterium]MDZ7300296.1 3-hydroxyacyl-CoA dehydrogenase NAD-binding domain-containing protein [candidate division KSB1 bacterium]MDZ7309481.1 3-hydroxyacyl-CoA dehydr
MPLDVTTPSSPAPAAPAQRAAAALRLEAEAGVGFLIIDVPDEKVNILSSGVMAELDQRLDEIAAHNNWHSLVILSGKPGNFIAGAQIAEIMGITNPEEGAVKAALGQAVFDKLAALPQVTIAVIDGACVGGGLELALACDFRMARLSTKTRLGLPEVRLGIIPGFGGTQRLPRLIGIQRALDFILTGRTVDAMRAYRAGLVDRVIPAEFGPEMLRSIGHAFAIELRSEALQHKIKARRHKINARGLLLEKNFLGRKVLFDQARKRVKAETRGHYPAPLLALEAVERGFPLDLRAGLAVEAELLGRAIVTPQSKNLIKVFYLSEEIKKDKGVPGFQGSLLTIKRVGVLGAGVMGGGIAQLLAQNDLPTRMKDVNYAAVAKGTAAAAKVFAEAVKKRRMTPKEMQNRMALITGTIDYSGFSRVDLVLEAIVENLDLKKKVFAEIDGIAPPHAVLASNTSALPVTEMARATRRPDKVAGLHFFNPVHLMPLVEVVRAEQTSDETVASLVAFAKQLGKTPVVVKDAPGFLVNRLLSVYMSEAARMLMAGGSIAEIDRALLAFGMPMGPFELIDEVGLDVAAKVSKVMRAAFGERMAADGALDRLVAAGRLGRKNGRGFYLHEGKHKQVDPAVYGLLDLAPGREGRLGREEPAERCMLLMINEAAQCLVEGVVRRPHEVDAGMIFGTGFPPFRGGLLRYADSLGTGRVVERLEFYANRHGAHFQPVAALLDLARQNKNFYH